MVVVGIDPGLGGAIAFLDIDDQKRPSFSAVIDCPLIAGEMDLRQIINVFRSEGKMPTIVGIEKAQAMRRQGVVQGTVSMFNYGRNYGHYIGILVTMNIPYMEIQTQAWKREFGLLKTEKTASILTAKSLFPVSEVVLTRKKDHGRADAILIAEHTRRRWDGISAGWKWQTEPGNPAFVSMRER